MSNKLVLSVFTWIVLTVAVIALALYRKYITRGEYDVLHIRDAESMLIPQQAVFARRVETIDFWGKLLTATVIGYGLLIFGAVLYQVWLQNT